MEDKFKSDRMKIQLVEISGYEFIKNGKITQPWLEGHIKDPARRDKIEHFKKLMLSGKWLDIRRACISRTSCRGIPNFIRTLSRKSPVLIFLPDGRPWEGKHRISAVMELRGQIKPVEFACITGWPGSERIDCKRYIRSSTARRDNYNAVRILVENKFNPAELPPADRRGRFISPGCR